MAATDGTDDTHRSRPDAARQGVRRSSAAIVVIMVAMALVAALGVLTLYAQRRAHPVQSQTNSDCDTQPAPPPNFLTFAACGDGAKTAAKPTSR
jgi:hypothetical protein